MLIACTYLPAFVTVVFRSMPLVWRGRHRLMLCRLIFTQAVYPNIINARGFLERLQAKAAGTLLKSGLGLGEHQVSGDKDRSEKSVGIAVLAYLVVLLTCHHEIVPGKPWSIFQLQHTLRLRVMTN
jgi:hypothetical protein